MNAVQPQISLIYTTNNEKNISGSSADLAGLAHIFANPRSLINGQSFLLMKIE